MKKHSPLSPTPSPTPHPYPLQMKKHVIDANKVVINKATSEQQVKEATFEFNDVFAVDIVMSSGEGKPKQLDNPNPNPNPNPTLTLTLTLTLTRQAQAA